MRDAMFAVGEVNALHGPHVSWVPHTCFYGERMCCPDTFLAWSAETDARIPQGDHHAGVAIHFLPGGSHFDR